MRPIIVVIAFVFASQAGMATTLEQCNAEKSFASDCTRLRVETTDLNGDHIIDEAEAKGYFGRSDWPVQVAVRNGKALSNEVDTAWLDALTYRGEDTDELPYSTDDFVGLATHRNRTWRQRLAPSTPKVTLSANRRLNDGVDPRGGGDVKPRPVVIAYRNDRTSGEEGAQVFGTFSANFIPWIDRPRRGGAGDESDSSRLVVAPSVALIFDVDTSSKSRGKDKSDISVAPTLSVMLKGNHSDDHWTDHYFSFAPVYQTDADFGRSVINLTATYSFASTDFLKAGLNQCWIGTCTASGWQWFWRPSVQLIAGDVRNASGNATLAALEAQGSYARLVPGATFRFFPVSGASSFGFDWLGIQDDEGRFRTYRELSYQYDLRSNVAFTVIYRKGVRASSFQNVDAVLLGFGIQY